MFLSSLFNDAVNRREYTVSERDKWISMEHHWNGTDRRKQKHSENTCSTTNSFATNSTWTGPGFNPEFRKIEDGE